MLPRTCLMNKTRRSCALAASRPINALPHVRRRARTGADKFAVSKPTLSYPWTLCPSTERAGAGMRACPSWRGTACRTCPLPGATPAQDHSGFLTPGAYLRSRKAAADLPPHRPQSRAAPCGPSVYARVTPPWTPWGSQGGARSCAATPAQWARQCLHITTPEARPYLTYKPKNNSVTMVDAEPPLPGRQALRTTAGRPAVHEHLGHAQALHA